MLTPRVLWRVGLPWVIGIPAEYTYRFLLMSCFTLTPTRGKKINALRRHGMRILAGVDQRSNLPNFSAFEFDGVKVAADLMSMVAMHGAVSTALEATIRACEGLGLMVLIDGISTAEHIQWVRRFGNVELQRVAVSAAVSASGDLPLLGRGQEG